MHIYYNIILICLLDINCYKLNGLCDNGIPCFSLMQQKLQKTIYPLFPAAVEIHIRLACSQLTQSHRQRNVILTDVVAGLHIVSHRRHQCFHK
jgi:hypothetical protein